MNDRHPMRHAISCFLRRGLLPCGLAVLAGCGMEAAGTAAAGAAIKQQEIQQGQATQAAVEQRIGAAMQQSEQRQRELEAAGK